MGESGGVFELRRGGTRVLVTAGPAHDVALRDALLRRRFAGDPVDARSARTAMTTWLAERGESGALVQQAALVTSELAANAVQEAPGHRFLVLARHRPVTGDLVLRVVNDLVRTGRPPPSGPWVLPPPASPQGRGLAIVTALADEVAVRGTTDRVAVTVVLRRPAR